MSFLAALLLLLSGPPQAAWLQWGGPTRDFQVLSANVPDSWPSDGPRRLWKRDLGAGFSSIVTDGRTLYTLFKRENQTVVVALDAATGKTVWEKGFDAAPTPAEEKEMDLVHGFGPGSTPLIDNKLLFAITFMGRLVALDRQDGRMAWSQELIRNGGTLVAYGTANSPLANKDTIIVPVGGRGQAIQAFRKSDGVLKWKSGDGDNANSSPVLARLFGEDQVVTVMQDEVLSMNPETGAILWRHPHSDKTDIEASDPVAVADDTLLVASLNIGTRAIQVKRENGRITTSELWRNKKMRVMHGNMLRIGDYIYASSGGGFGPSPLTAMRISTGEIVWQERALKMTLLGVNGKAIVVDEDGKLYLIRLAPEGMKILAESQQLASPAWTPPTLSGSRLFLRDTKSIMALELAER
jgi:outer membrane protein assembly factor BamB